MEVTDKEQKIKSLEQKREPEPDIVIMEQPEQKENNELLETINPEQEAGLSKVAQPNELELPPPPDDGKNKNKHLLKRSSTRKQNKRTTSWAALESNSLWSWMADYPWGGG